MDRVERVVKANGIDVWCESFGDVNDPAVLLIMGAGAQGTSWDEPFCEELAAAGRYVIRYDNRDTGVSTCFDFESSPYDLGDLAADAAGLLDALGLPSAHVVGASMGGMIAQELAINFPGRMATLALLITSPAVPEPGNPMAWSGGLPPMKPVLLQVIMEQMMSVAASPDERATAFLTTARVLAGPFGHIDEAAVRAGRLREEARAVNLAAAANHSLAIQRSRDRLDRLPGITCPTIVICGTEDPAFPPEHSRLLAQLIPQAKLFEVEGMGHDLSFDPDLLMRMIREHTASSATVAQ